MMGRGGKKHSIWILLIGGVTLLVAVAIVLSGPGEAPAPSPFSPVSGTLTIDARVTAREGGLGVGYANISLYPMGSVVASEEVMTNSVGRVLILDVSYPETYRVVVSAKGWETTEWDIQLEHDDYPTKVLQFRLVEAP